jgi:hypothetical protein
MTRPGDDGFEMPHDPFDDSAIERLLAGDTAGGGDLAPLSSFIDDARTAAEAVPPPSPALAAALATGILPAPAPAPQSLWRKSKMKVQGFLAGLGVAGKLALGVGVAAAATTGAGAAGLLPGPVQHAVSSAVGAVTPFELPDGTHHDGGDVAEPGTTTTTIEAHGDDGESTPTTEHRGDVTPTPTTEHHDGDTTPTTEAHSGDGDTSPTTEAHSGDGDHESTPTTEHHDGEGDTTPTTENHDGEGGDGGDGTTTTTMPHPAPTALSLTCSQVDAHVSCSWAASSDPDHHVYRLYRGDNKVFSSETGLSYNDFPSESGEFHYYIRSYRNDGSIDSQGTVTVTFTA